MFNNIGRKIKTLAQVICWVGIIASIVAAIVVLSTRPRNDEWLALLILVGGSLFSWIGSFFTYGFGELIEKTTAIERNTRGGVQNNTSNAVVESPYAGVQQAEVSPVADTKRLEKLERLRAQGLITEEEYQQAIANNK